MSQKPQFATHAIHNLPLPLPAYNAWSSDTPLQEAVKANGGSWASDHLFAHGAMAGGELVELGELANRNKPVLKQFDRFGRRIDQVEFHPSYHEVMRLAMQHEVHSFPWVHENEAGAHVVRAAMVYMGSQQEAGTGCPLAMTYAAVPVLLNAPKEIAQVWLPKLLANKYDPRSIPVEQKTACTIGMGMTEKQGGSDVRQNDTRAYKQADGSYELVGHKWFYSAPMCDAHLVLAKADGGLSCFLTPRILPDGTSNAIRLQRLKDKLGDWSNASSEVEFQGATAYLIGEEGRGVPTIIQMVALTRLDCIVGSAAGMRQALVQVMHHVHQRSAFGKVLIDQPLMRNVLADLALENEASVALAMRVARAVDATPRDQNEAALARVLTAIAKYWVCKRAPAFINEAQECLGGNGFIEESILPRLYRQAPLNSLWEGCGNVQCLDVLRAFHKEPETFQALFAELQKTLGKNSLYDAQFERLAKDCRDNSALELRSRGLVERIALLFQAALLLQHSDENIANTFCLARLGEYRGTTYGTLAADAPVARLIERAAPVL